MAEPQEAASLDEGVGPNEGSQGDDHVQLLCRDDLKYVVKLSYRSNKHFKVNVREGVSEVHTRSQ